MPLQSYMGSLRAHNDGLKTTVVNHTFRATGITSYLENGGGPGAGAGDGQPLVHPHHPAS